MKSPLHAKLGFNKVVGKNLLLLAFMIGAAFYFSSRDAFAFLTSVYGGTCRSYAFDGPTFCAVLGFCTFPGDAQTFVYSEAYSSLTCPNLAPSVLNEAQSDGVVGGPGVSASAQATTIPGFRTVGRSYGVSQCNGVIFRDTQYFPENCYAIFVPPPPGDICLAGPVNEDSSKTPAPTLADMFCCDSVEQMNCFNGGGEWSESTCSCLSPIVIDVAGNGFDLTNADNGVVFDLVRTGSPEKISWTSVDSDDAWLVLDRNNNGIIDDGKELFGSSTPQPYLSPGESKNGFRALAMFDKAANGGNDDKQIDNRDSVFAHLMLWQDRNHNGISEATELQSLSGSGIRIIEVTYKESRRQDDQGNWFRYRAKVTDEHGVQAGRWAWDVFVQKTD